MNTNIIERGCAVSIILDEKNRILLQKKDSGYHFGPNRWSLFGGMIEEGEDAKKTIIREIKEEIGLEITEYDIHFLKDYVYEGILGKKSVKIDHKIFILKFDGNLKKIRLGEGVGFALFEKQEMKDLNLVEPTKNMLEMFYENNTSL